MQVLGKRRCKGRSDPKPRDEENAVAPGSCLYRADKYYNAGRDVVDTAVE